MQGIIKNYRRSIKSQNCRQAVVEIEGITTKAKAAALLGAMVQWKQKKGKTINGKIIAVHGSNGAVRARFDPALPGQAIGEKVEITPKKKPLKAKPSVKKSTQK